MFLSSNHPCAMFCFLQWLVENNLQMNEPILKNTELLVFLKYVILIGNMSKTNEWERHREWQRVFSSKSAL